MTTMSDETQQNSTKLNTLTPTQRVFVMSRARGKSVIAAAKEAGINRTTPAATWDMDLINAAILELQQAMFTDGAKAVEHIIPDAIENLASAVKRGDIQAIKEVLNRRYGMPKQQQDNRNWDMSGFSDEELARIADGETPEAVMRSRKQ